MAAEEKRESREEEIARVRGYLVSVSMKRTPAQLVEMLREAHQQLLEAAALIPEDAFSTPREGEWSAADVLRHVSRMSAYEERTICGVLERGEQPGRISDERAVAAGASRKQTLADITASRDRLAAVVLQADPQAHLDVVWQASEFGELNWRGWLLFARIHTLDHARQIQAIASALSSH